MFPDDKGYFYYRDPRFSPHVARPGYFTEKCVVEVEKYRIKFLTGSDATRYTPYTQDEYDLIAW